MSRTANQPGPHRSIPSGPILVDAVYPIGQGMTLAGWGARSLAEAKRRGLKVLTFGKRSYIYGADLLEFLRSQPTIERHGGNGRPDLAARHAAGPSISSGQASKKSSGRWAENSSGASSESAYLRPPTIH